MVKTDFVFIVIIAIMVIASSSQLIHLNQNQKSHNDTMELPDVIETSKPLSSAKELKSLFVQELFIYDNPYIPYSPSTPYEENTELIELATVNAKNGTNSIRLVGDNVAGAYYAYTLYLRARAKQNGYYFGSEDKNKVEAMLRVDRNYPGSYGLAVYQDGNYYNVSAVLRSHNPDESVKDNNGAYSVRIVPDTITYLWADQKK